jgi:phosphatidylserine decarboxylase
MVPLIMGVVTIVLSVQLVSYVFYIAANVFFLISVLVIIIFRDPPRNIGRGIVSPADGKIVNVNRDRNSLSISTALHKVHVNRAPIGGRVLQVERSIHYGGETEITIDTKIGPVKIGQKPRSIPRTVIPYVTERRRVAKGQRIAVAIPSALVNVRFPDSVQITVNEGQKVLAGVTSVGEVVRAV